MAPRLDLLTVRLLGHSPISMHRVAVGVDLVDFAQV